jgi:hypothetical protein
MKRAIVIMIMTVVVFTGCNLIGSIFEPIIGSWERTILGVTVQNTYHADGTTIETNSLGELGVTRTGTWKSDPDFLTVTWEDESKDEYSYSFNSDHTEMTLVPKSGGFSTTYTRQ